MLEKKYRLTKKEDFDSVFKKGAWVRGRLLSLRIKKTTNIFPRIGLVVGIKTAKKAVIRNRIKRQIRASFSKHIEGMKGGFDIVVVPAPEIVEEKFIDIHGEITQLLTKIHIIDD